MLKLTVNDVEVEVEDGSTVLHACEEAGVEIPRFCYHDRLSIAGNCRMCLVDMERAPKPIASSSNQCAVTIQAITADNARTDDKQSAVDALPPLKRYR